MGSVWFSKKAFLYFGGAIIILIGGAIVYTSPYHYINFSVTENEQRTFDIWAKDGYHEQLEVSVSLRPGNSSVVNIGLVLFENASLDTIIVNLTLDEDNLIETPDAIFYEGSTLIDIPYGNYTVRIDQLDGVNLIDLGLKQISDSRLWITIGGSMNILGLIMGIAGYIVPGTFLPTDSDTIVEWGYDEEENQDEYSEK
ncbi:MAG: hypothetical protein ACFFE2_01405 [Candidatus Thorarchaeota archaeon]